MATIKRPDDNQFVIQTYRELLHSNKRSFLVQELRLLSEQHGAFVHIEKLPDATVEAVFTNESGYLLAESIWDYLNKPENLIFCEAIEDSQQIVLIVVRSGSILIDTRIAAADLGTELLSILADKQAYQVIVSNNAPLSDVPAEDHVVLPMEAIDSFERLEGPILPLIPLQAQYCVQPLKLALRSARLTVNPVVAVSMATGLFIAIIVGAWWLLPTTRPENPVRLVAVRVAPNPYAAYNKALLSASPQALLSELAKNVSHMTLIPGWAVANITFNNNIYLVRVKPDGGNLQMLAKWAKQNHYEYRITSNGPELLAKSQLISRHDPAKIYPSQQVLTLLIDRLDQLLNQQAVAIGAQQQQGKAIMTPITVNLHSVSPKFLEMIALELGGLPITLNSLNVNVGAGMIAGTIQLSVWGT